MRWFFLPFIPLLALVGNLIAFSSDLSPLRLAMAVAFNIFVVSLSTAWWHAYFTFGARRSRGLLVGHALLMLSLAMTIFSIGVYALATGDCSVIGSASRPDRLGSMAATYAQSYGLCRPLGILVGAFGAALALPSIRLLASLRSGALYLPASSKKN